MQPPPLVQNLLDISNYNNNNKLPNPVKTMPQDVAHSFAPKTRHRPRGSVDPIRRLGDNMTVGWFTESANIRRGQAGQAGRPSVPARGGAKYTKRSAVSGQIAYLNQLRAPEAIYPVDGLFWLYLRPFQVELTQSSFGRSYPAIPEAKHHSRQVCALHLTSSN